MCIVVQITLGLLACGIVFSLIQLAGVDVAELWSRIVKSFKRGEE